MGRLENPCNLRNLWMGLRPGGRNDKETVFRFGKTQVKIFRD